MSDNSSDKPAEDLSAGGRRQEDRRKAQLPIDGPDRRQGDRRKGADRRTAPRTNTGDLPEV